MKMEIVASEKPSETSAKIDKPISLSLYAVPFVLHPHCQCLFVVTFAGDIQLVRLHLQYTPFAPKVVYNL